MDEVRVHGVFAFFAFICLIGLFFTAWQSLVVDAVRQRMFEIRDKAFLWAYDNGRLDDVAYREFRDIANAAIRHYENMSLLKIFVLKWFFDLEARAGDRRMAFLEDVHLRKEFQRLVEVSAVGLAIRSSLLMTLFVFLLPVVLLLAVLYGKASMRSGTVAANVSREVQADILVAACNDPSYRLCCP